jgi:hypothetical protein
MTRYAAKTEVPVVRTKMEIEELVARYGAGQFMSYTSGDLASIGFSMEDRQVRFDLKLPDSKEKRFHIYMRGSVPYERDPAQALKLWEQECRSLWRALLLVVKAKLEAVEIGISTFEREFMANIVMPGGQLLHEHVSPRIAHIYSTGEDIPLLPGPSGR